MTVQELANARKQAHVSQIELAKRMGAHQSGISRVETGKINPSLDFVNAYLKALNLKLTIVEE